MKLADLKALFMQFGCHDAWAVRLDANSDGKHGLRIAGGLQTLHRLPFASLELAPSRGPSPTVKGSLNFWWIGDDGLAHRAPHASAVVYSRYGAQGEFRLSSLVRGGGPDAPSALVKSQVPDRVLYLGVASNKRMFGYLAAPGSSLAKAAPSAARHGVAELVELPIVATSQQREKLTFSGLRSVALRGALPTTRLLSDGLSEEPTASRNRNGYTLEWQLRVPPNARSEPDYLGWELKATATGEVTMIDLAPTGGLFCLDRAKLMKDHGKPGKTRGIRTFTANKSKVRVALHGFDRTTGKIDYDGRLSMESIKGVELASWSFERLLGAWQLKHARTAIVEAKGAKTAGGHEVSFGPTAFRCVGPSFPRLLAALHDGHVRLDPSLGIRTSSGKPTRMNWAFRVRLTHLNAIYEDATQVVL